MIRLSIASFAVLVGAEPVQGQTFQVNVAFDGPDDGACRPLNFEPPRDCTLREAITDANQAAGADDITFAQYGTDPSFVFTVMPTSPLPAITAPASITGGTTLPGYVRINGVGAGAGAHGLQVTAGNDVNIGNLAIYNFGGSGINVTGGNSHYFTNLYLGNTDGATAAPNGGHGIRIGGSSNNQVLFSVIGPNAGYGIAMADGANNS